MPTGWRVLELGAVAIATVVGGAAAAIATAWLLARVGRRFGTDPKIDGLITERGAGAPVGTFDEQLRERAKRRRQRADEVRRDSVRILTKDATPGDHLRRAK